MTEPSPKDESKRKEALAKLERIAARVQARNQDLTEEEAWALADRFIREVIDDMVRDGSVRYDDASS